jgi:tetratricopeptide (TPR) repeat protein
MTTKHLTFLAAAIVFAACDSAPQPVVNTNSPANASQRSEKTQTVTAHTTENQKLPGAENSNSGKTKWTQSGDPIDTKELDAAIASADKALKVKPDDGEAKSTLAECYFNRAMALTEARQYASALGDYRRTLKYNPDHEQAKQWVDQILMIYNSMGREAPPDGKEPRPLTVKP